MIFKDIINTKIVYCVIIFAFGTFLSGYNSAYAASLYLNPSSADLTVGNILNVSILVNTQGQAINNVDAIINFPASLLEVISISKSGSIFTLWVEEPAFSNTIGRITFNGGLPTPGFSNSAGRLVNIAFRVKASGTASLFFSAGSVRANDGFGTDVLSSMGTATFAISPAPVAPIPEPAPAPAPAPVPVVVPVIDEPVIEEVHYTPPEPVELVIEKNWNNRIVEFISNINLGNSLLFWLIIFIVLLAIFLIYGRSRFIRLRSGVRRETYDVEKVLHHSFDTIKEDIVACVGLLERARRRRHLTEEERAVVSLLKQHLRQTEELVTKEIDDIRRHAEK